MYLKNDNMSQTFFGAKYIGGKIIEKFTSQESHHGP
jgi:hypothetical protein